MPLLTVRNMEKESQSFLFSHMDFPFSYCKKLCNFPQEWRLNLLSSGIQKAASEHINTCDKSGPVSRVRVCRKLWVSFVFTYSCIQWCWRQQCTDWWSLTGRAMLYKWTCHPQALIPFLWSLTEPTFLIICHIVSVSCRPHAVAPSESLLCLSSFAWPSVAYA